MPGHASGAAATRDMCPGCADAWCQAALKDSVRKGGLRVERWGNVSDVPLHRILVNQGGEPYQHENYLGDAVTTWRDKLKLLRLYDTRGTAAT